jgi:hypothetical protein
MKADRKQMPSELTIHLSRHVSRGGPIRRTTYDTHQLLGAH